MSRVVVDRPAGSCGRRNSRIVGTMFRSLVRGGLVAVVVVCAGCSPQPEGATQRPAEAKAEAKADAPADVKAADAKADGEALCSPGASLETCDGKRVRLEGKKPMMVMQHPMMNAGPPGMERHQSYLEVDGGAQIIVISEAVNACEGAMAVTGTLRSIDMGGPEGTKDSYKGWQVTGAAVECR